MSQTKSRGFTLVELLTVMVILGLISGLIYGFYNGVIGNFLRLQTVSFLVAEETRTIARMSKVLRGTTKIEDASTNTVTVLTYFSPTDTKLSKVTYLYNPTAKQLTVSRILASGVAPNYTYKEADRKTIVLLRDLELKSHLFSYEDSSGSSGPFEAETFKDIQVVVIDINANFKGNVAPTELKTLVMLRNKRGNL